MMLPSCGFFRRCSKWICEGALSMNSVSTALQDMAAPDGVCYGCGSAHPEGLHIKSRWHEDGIHVVCTHTPDPKFHGWPELVYGGLLAMLVDCHSNWTAMAYHRSEEHTSELQSRENLVCR